MQKMIVMIHLANGFINEEEKTQAELIGTGGLKVTPDSIKIILEKGNGTKRTKYWKTFDKKDVLYFGSYVGGGDFITLHKKSEEQELEEYENKSEIDETDNINEEDNF